MRVAVDLSLQMNVLKQTEGSEDIGCKYYFCGRGNVDIDTS